MVTHIYCVIMYSMSCENIRTDVIISSFSCNLFKRFVRFTFDIFKPLYLRLISRYLETIATQFFIDLFISNSMPKIYSFLFYMNAQVLCFSRIHDLFFSFSYYRKRLSRPTNMGTSLALYRWVNCHECLSYVPSGT